jgi:hypothetical protein
MTPPQTPEAMAELQKLLDASSTPPQPTPPN